jgi:hypothetical protein
MRQIRFAVGVVAMVACALTQAQGQPGFTQDPVPVVVTNTAPVPVTVSVKNQEKPFQALICSDSGAISCGNAPESVLVPADQTLTIEFVSASCELLDATNTLLTVNLRTTAGGNTVLHQFGATPVSPPVPTGNRYTVSQPTRLYADGNTEVIASMFVFGLEGRRCFVTLSGHLRSN